MPNRKRSRPRAKTIARKLITREKLRQGALEYPPDPLADLKPRTRDMCEDMPRPCPFVSCKYHLYLDVDPEIGSIKLNFPDVPADRLELLEETCALDVAERDGVILDFVGQLINLTRERIRQVESRAFAQLHRAAGGDLEQLRAVHVRPQNFNGAKLCQLCGTIHAGAGCQGIGIRVRQRCKNCNGAGHNARTCQGG